MHRILLVGAGTGNTLTANLLAKELKKEIKAGDVAVEVLGENDIHAFQPGNLDVAFRGVDPKKFLHAQAPLLDKNIQFSTEGAENIDLEAGKVRTKAGREITYDHLILGTGGVAHPELIPGFKEGSLSFHRGPIEAKKIYEALENMDSGHVVVAITEVPYKCPPSPNEATFLADEYFRKRGIRDKVEITLLTPYPHAYPAPTIAEQVEERYKDLGIEVGSFFNLESVDVENKVVKSLEGEQMEYDLLIGIPPHRGADVIQESGIGDKEGWIPTDKETMRVVGHDNVYALGDGTNLPISKSGVVAHLQAVAIADNILSQLGRKKGEWAYNGRINCPMEIGDHKLLFISATYTSPPQKDKPTTVKYAMKKAFNRMYWTALGGNLEWMFKLYFGETTEHRFPEAPGEAEDKKEEPVLAR